LIIGRVLILLGICSFVLTLVSNYFDILLQIENKNEITQLGQFWFYFAPDNLQIAEAIVSRYVDPCSALNVLNCSGFIWHPFISSILLLPAAPFLVLLSFVFIALGIKKSARKKSSNQTTNSKRVLLIIVHFKCFKEYILRYFNATKLPHSFLPAFCFSNSFFLRLISPP